MSPEFEWLFGTKTDWLKPTGGAYNNIDETGALVLRDSYPPLLFAPLRPLTRLLGFALRHLQARGVGAKSIGTLAQPPRDREQLLGCLVEATAPPLQRGRELVGRWTTPHVKSLARHDRIEQRTERARLSRDAGGQLVRRCRFCSKSRDAQDDSFAVSPLSSA